MKLYQTTVLGDMEIRNGRTLDRMGHSNSRALDLCSYDDAFRTYCGDHGVCTETVYALCLDGLIAREVDAFADAEEPWGGNPGHGIYSEMMWLSDVYDRLHPCELQPEQYRCG